jgi:hypothetical protein
MAVFLILLLLSQQGREFFLPLVCLQGSANSPVGIFRTDGISRQGNATLKNDLPENEA